MKNITYLILIFSIITSCNSSEAPNELLKHWKNQVYCIGYNLEENIGFNCMSIISLEQFPLEYEFYSDWTVKTNKYHPNCIGEYSLSDYDLSDFETELIIQFPCNTAYLKYNIIKIDADTLILGSFYGVQKLVKIP